jgi:hypothetical protein
MEVNKVIYAQTMMGKKYLLKLGVWVSHKTDDECDVYDVHNSLDV